MEVVYIKFHLNPTKGSRADARGLTDNRKDGRTDAQTNILTPFQSRTAPLCRFNVADSNKIYLGFHAKGPIFLSYITQFGFSQRTFRENSQYQILCICFP